MLAENTLSYGSISVVLAEKILRLSVIIVREVSYYAE